MLFIKKSYTLHFPFIATRKVMYSYSLYKTQFVNNIPTYLLLLVSSSQWTTITKDIPMNKSSIYLSIKVIKANYFYR